MSLHFDGKIELDDSTTLYLTLFDKSLSMTVIGAPSTNVCFEELISQGATFSGLLIQVAQYAHSTNFKLAVTLDEQLPAAVNEALMVCMKNPNSPQRTVIADWIRQICQS